jgi:hypothetical protein
MPTNPGPNPGPIVDPNVAKILDLESQLLRIKQSGEVSPGNLQNQVDGMAMLMLDVSRILKMPGDMHIRDLPKHAEAIMKLVPAGAQADLDKAMAARGA